MTLYRLEFNETQQTFHMDNFTHKEKTYGWITVSVDEDLKLSLFIEYMDHRYKYTFSSEKKTLTKEVVLKEWDSYQWIFGAISDNAKRLFICK